MDFRKILFGDSSSRLSMPTEFKVKIERQTTYSVVQFDGKVTGYFVARRGKPEFVTEEIEVEGLPGVNLRNFFPQELKEVKKYALSVELPKILAKSVR